MNCRIELPAAELHSLSPNFDYLTSLLQILAPDEVAGTVAISGNASGVGLEFAGARGWRGISVGAEIIPGWMFRDMAFRELLAKRVQEFVDLLEHLQPGTTEEESNGVDWSEGWAIG